MSQDKQKALETLEKVKEIYDNEGGDLLCGGFWSDFMAVVNSQITEISQNTQLKERKRGNNYGKSK